MTQRPPSTLGMHHLALNVRDLEACEHFYVGLVGMQVEWRPDPDNLYLCSGTDNLALHRTQEAPTGAQRLDHLGFICRRAEDVDSWYAFLASNGITFRSEPRTHRDGARSFYCEDPEGNVVQFIHHPPLAGG
jgi:catechol 2,3-dioxygenase-like lactoylglutathione lyase family enzyme